MGRGFDEGGGHAVGVGGRVGTELTEQEAAAGGEQLDVVDGEVLAQHKVDEQSVEAFEADRLEGEDGGDVVGSDEGVVEAEGDEAAVLRALAQFAGGFEDGDAGALGAHQRARDVEAVLRQELVEVVAGDAARDVGESLADEAGASVAQAAQAGVDFAATAACGDDGGEFFFRCAADGHARAVVEEDVERLDVVDRLAAEQAVDAAGVVADHAAEGAAAVGCRVGGEGELVLLGFVAEGVEDEARLDAGEARGGIKVEDRVHVAGEIDDDGDVAALAGEAGAAATREDGRAELAACGDGGNDVGGVEGQDKADGDLAVV